MSGEEKKAKISLYKILHVSSRTLLQEKEKLFFG